MMRNALYSDPGLMKNVKAVKRYMARGGSTCQDTTYSIAGWWVGHAFKSEMVSDTIWVGVFTILNDQNGIYNFTNF